MRKSEKRKSEKHNKTRYISVLLIIAGCAGLSAAAVMTPQIASVKPVNRTVLTVALCGDTETQKIAEEAAQEFEKKEDCRVDIYCYSSEEELETNIYGQFASGKGFDVFYTNKEMLKKLYEKDVILDLDDVIRDRNGEKEYFYERALAEGQLGEKQYAVPIGVMPYMICYNSSLLEELGMTDPQEIFDEGAWTEENFYCYLSKVSKLSGSPAMVVSSDWPVVEMLVYSEIKKGGTEAGEADWTEAAEAVTDSLGSLMKNGIVEVDDSESYELLRDSFAAGKIPFLIGRLDVTRACYNSTFTWDILPFPSEESDFSGTAMDISLIAAGKGQHQDLARRFISYYSSTAGQKTRLEAGECQMPSLNMVFYTSMGNVSFPEHANYYFYVMDEGYSLEDRMPEKEEREKVSKLWETALLM